MVYRPLDEETLAEVWIEIYELLRFGRVASK